MTENSWLFFLAASLLVIVSPGQDMVLVLSRGVSRGAAAGIATAAGVSTGLLGHSLLAGLGLGALLRTSETLFLGLKVVGAAYLAYLGLRLILNAASSLQLQAAAGQSRRRMFFEGALSNLSNPKVAVFYFAFLPQFVPAAAPNSTLMIFTLGVAFAALTFLVKGPVGYFAGVLSGWLRARPKVLAWIYRSSGAVLVGLGLRLVLEERG